MSPLQGIAALVLALAPLCAGARGAGADEGKPSLSGYLNTFLTEENQARLWSSAEILPGIPKAAVSTGLLLDVVTGQGREFLLENQARHPEYLTTDPANLLALSRLLSKMRVSREAWSDREVVIRRAWESPDTTRVARVLVLAADYDRVDWGRVSAADPLGRLPLAKGFLFCASAAPVPGGGPLTVEFTRENVVSNRPLSFANVKVTHQGRTQVAAFPGAIVIPDFDPIYVVACEFPVGNETFTAYLDLAPK